MISIGALSFASPLLLAALTALPALWLLFRAAPPPPRIERFPAFVLLKDLDPRAETPHRTPLLLLILRTLAAAAVILALAGPSLNAPTARVGGGPILLVVDDTLPAAPQWRAREAALSRVVSEAAASGRPLFLLTTADPARSGLVGPLAPAAARPLIDALQPKPFFADRAAAAVALDKSSARGALDIRWLADGVSGEGDREFVAALKRRGTVIAMIDDSLPFFLRPPKADGGGYVVERLDSSGAATAKLSAIARDGRQIGTATAKFADGATTAEATFDLPLALRNALGRVAVVGVRSAGAAVLADARDRRALVGILASRDAAGEALLSGAHYVRKALAPYAEFATGSVEAMIASGASAIVLDDVGRIRATDAAALKAWVDKGGVLIRFAGDTLANSIDDQSTELLPVRLRGGRAVGGALSWETPQKLGPYAADGPFATLPLPNDALVRRQVLAEPGGEASRRSWASLADGTPLVTGTAQGRGAVVLFHVTATPDWSDLPLTDTFVDMLRAVVQLAGIGPAQARTGAAALAPVRTLDAFGRLGPPPPGAENLTPADAARGPRPGLYPGLYGAPEAPAALNALAPSRKLAALDASGIERRPYTGAAPVRLGGPLFLAALLLLAADAVLTLIFSGRLAIGRAAVAAVLGAALFAPIVERAVAQPLDRPVAAATEEAALKTRLAFIRSGDAGADALAERGLAALSAILAQRTSLEPAAPAAVDPETDDLSVYPFVYWRVVAGAAPPSEAALANVENFMRFGGLVVFDTADDERAAPGVDTPEQEALRALLSRLDAPPLSPLPREHVLRRSFYLLDDLAGRSARNPVWVQTLKGANDDVTPLIIGGRDWAGAWAGGDGGAPAGPGASAREYALRAGVNMVMVAFTGNYKSDQVHTTALLKRLQR